MWQEMDLKMVEAFDNKFKRGRLYSNAEIKEEIKRIQPCPVKDNPAAYCYNRWNKGMPRPSNLFEYVSRNQYRYLGSNYSYSGRTEVAHRGKPSELIGTWTDGKFKFAKGFRSFDEWKKA